MKMVTLDCTCMHIFCQSKILTTMYVQPQSSTKSSNLQLEQGDASIFDIFCIFLYFQVIVQRTLGAKNNIQAKAGSIFAGFLKILPIFIMVMPGMISRVLYPDSIGCADPVSCKFHCDNEWGCSNNAYPK